MTCFRHTAMRLAAVLGAFFALTVPALAQEAPPATGGAEATIDRPGLHLRPGALFERTLALRGRTEAGDAGLPVRFELLAIDGSWRQIAAGVVAPDGTFSAAWRADVAGKLTLRAVVDRPAGEAVAASGPLVAQVTIFKSVLATWYGPGFFGRKTACGQRLGRRTLGVAHRTLPCGTNVDLYYRGKTISVPVIDRGPFRNGADWDLTQATAEALGVRSTVRVGALAPEPTAFKRARSRSR